MVLCRLYYLAFFALFAIPMTLKRVWNEYSKSYFITLLYSIIKPSVQIHAHSLWLSVTKSGFDYHTSSRLQLRLKQLADLEHYFRSTVSFQIIVLLKNRISIIRPSLQMCMLFVCLCEKYTTQRHFHMRYIYRSVQNKGDSSIKLWVKILSFVSSEFQAAFRI